MTCTFCSTRSAAHCRGSQPKSCSNTQSRSAHGLQVRGAASLEQLDGSPRTFLAMNEGTVLPNGLHEPPKQAGPRGVAESIEKRSRDCSPMDGGDARPHFSSGGPRSNKGSGFFNFKETEELKAQVREKILSPTAFDVKNDYWEHGLFQKIARDHAFENVTLGVISLNAVWMGVDTDRNGADTFLEAGPLFQTADSFFCVYFTAELLIRFMAFRSKHRCLHSGWFVFDSVLVALMLMETVLLTLLTLASGGSGESPLGQSSILRLFRLARLSRLTRLLRSFPELMIMIKGMVTAMKSVSFVLGLQVMILYVFGIAFTQLSWGYLHETYFENVGGAMYSLMIHATFLDDLASFCGEIKEESPWLLFLLSIFIFLAAMTVMNMLIGVLCEVISSVAEEENEAIACSTVKDKFANILSAADQDDSGRISYLEFRKLLEVNEALEALQYVGVDPVGMIDFAEDFFAENGDSDGEIEFKDFMSMVLDLRGSQVCKVRDLISLGRRLDICFTETEEKVDKLLKVLGVPEDDSKTEEIRQPAWTRRRPSQISRASERAIKA